MSVITALSKCPAASKLSLQYKQYNQNAENLGKVIWDKRTDLSFINKILHCPKFQMSCAVTFHIAVMFITLIIKTLFTSYVEI